MCGGVALANRGLSPRVRGNLVGMEQQNVPLGSIPACAGEPVPTQGRVHVYRVYPRVCGGTDFVRADYQLDDGLSPRVRGNPLGIMSEPVGEVKAG